jgi:maleylacetoacetate isomerase
MRLFHYWRSSSSWRVRWAFAYKGIEVEYVPVDLLKGEAEGAEHLKRNPLGLVPALELGHGQYLTESLAIIELAEETRPNPSLLPGDPVHRARIRMLAEMINADTQPLQNLSPQELHSEDPAQRKAWAVHWIVNGLGAYEKVARGTAGEFSVGDALTVADLCLAPQCYNALRYDVDLAQFPTVKRIYEAALATPSGQASHPDRFKP